MVLHRRWTHTAPDAVDAAGPAGVPVRPRHTRQADTLNAEWIARHRART
ncbi:hypothetical protein [Micromonospora chersina]